LFGITDAKVKQFLVWREEGRQEANVLMNDDSFRTEFERWLKEGMTSDARRKSLLQRLVAIQDAHGFEDILLFDKTSTLVLSTSPDALSPSSFGMNQISQVLHGGSIEYSDLHYLREDGHEHVRLGILAPIRPPGATSAPPSGVILLRADPTKDLFPSIQAWPMPTQSGETFLAHHEADSIIYLTELRHLKTSGMAARFSVTEEKLLAAQAARGKEGILDGEDYRGAAVIGAARLIPGTSWLIVSKIDKEEIYAPIRRTGWVVGIITLLFVSMAGITTAIWWRNQRNALLARVYQTRLMHESTKQRLDNVSKYANDIILLSDEQGHIIEANDRAVEAYGYSLAELQGMHGSMLRDPAWRDSFEKDVQSWSSEGSVYETVQRRRDGASFPVEVSARFVELDGRRLQQVIIRDISERKQAEAALIESQRQLRSLSVHQEGLLEDERKHIAREVHDELGQLLTALKMDISLLRLRFGQDPTLLEKLEGMRTLVEKTIHVVRQVASNLRPAALDLGLVPAIEWLAKDFSQRWDISCNIDMCGDEIVLDDVTATTVFRVVQESLTNVARYAHASEVTISLQCGNRLLLRVEDNGRGFDPSAVSKLPGFGLFGMRERIQALGGTLKIDSGSDMGTKLAIELPFSQGEST
ncbi:MAG: PAS domain-containing sensor histidine kinase, partial [Betaproteobacteria bacterium]|nr:PAS domain-containing sensor histidine kinase [Betaproteobacteria bacterium]